MALRASALNRTGPEHRHNRSAGIYMKRFDVSVVGELNPDLILDGLPEEIVAERELLASGLTITLGSSSAIFAHNLSALGSRVGFISRIGSDPLGHLCVERLAESGVDVSRVRRSASPALTGLTVILSHPITRNILTYPGTMFDLRFEDLDLDYLADSRHFHVSSYFLHRALLPRMGELFAAMKSAGLSTSLDVNDDPDDQWDSGVWDVLELVDVLFVNERELKKLARSQDVQVGIEKLSKLVRVLAVKLGPEGGLVADGGRVTRSPGLPVEVADSVGAGDSFDAGFLHQFVRGADLRTCLDFANLAGAFSTTRHGGTEAFRDAAYLEEFLSRHRRSEVTR